MVLGLRDLVKFCFSTMVAEFLIESILLKMLSGKKAHSFNGVYCTYTVCSCVALLF